MNYSLKPYKKNLGKKVKHCSIAIFLVGFMLLLTGNTPAQVAVTKNSNSFQNLNKALQVFGFRTMDQWSSDSMGVFVPYHLGNFLPETDNGQVAYMLYPYWLGRKYQSYAFDSIKRFGYFGYIINPEDGSPNLSYSYIANNIIEYAKTYKTGIPTNQIKNALPDVHWHDTKADLVLYIGGRNETNYFLQSKAARDLCIDIAFEYVCKRDSISNGNLFNADGVNVYFPHFSFELKRQYGLFIKNLFWKFQDSNTKKKIIVTLPLRDTIHFNYMLGLEHYIDEIHFANYDYRGVVRDKAIRDSLNIAYKSDETDLGLIKEIIAQMRIAEFYNPLNNMEGAAKENKWEMYFFFICFLLLLILTSIPLAFFWCSFNYLVNKYLVLYILFVILLLAEILFLFIFMIEEMTIDVWLINTENKESYLFLFIPIVLLLLFPAIKFLQKRKELP